MRKECELKLEMSSPKKCETCLSKLETKVRQMTKRAGPRLGCGSKEVIGQSSGRSCVIS